MALRISDIRGTSFVVSWTSDSPIDGHVDWGTGPQLGNTVASQNGAYSTTHYVRLHGLMPQTTYYLQVRSGTAVNNNDGNFFVVTTGPLLSGVPANQIFGRVVQADALTPAHNALIFITVQRAGVDSQVAALRTNDHGYWHYAPDNLRTSDAQAKFDPQPGEVVHIFADGGEFGDASLVGSLPDATTAMPDMVLDGSPLAVTLTSFWTSLSDNSIWVNWETASEIDNLGFNLYRNDHAIQPTVAMTFVPSQAVGSTQGFAYSYEDTDVLGGRTYYYWLESLDLHGGGVVFGPISAQLPGSETSLLVFLPLVTLNNTHQSASTQMDSHSSTDTTRDLSQVQANGRQGSGASLHASVDMFLDVGWNLVGLPLGRTPNPTAQEVLDEINDQGGNCQEVARWVANNWQGYTSGSGLDDFALELGRGYRIACTSSSVWTVDGYLVTAPVTQDLAPGWNLLTLPYGPHVMDPETWLDDIRAKGGVVTEIQQWIDDGWDGHVHQIPLDGFPIVRGRAYFVRSDQASIYQAQPPTNFFCGDINANTTWINDMVWVVTCHSRIRTGATLTIEPGTTVKFQGATAGLKVEGALRAEGSELERIFFTSVRDDDFGGDSDGQIGSPGPGDWAGIEFAGSAGAASNLDSLVLRYGETGLRLSAASLTLNNSIVSHHSSTGIACSNQGDLALSRVTIENNGGDGVSCAGTGSVDITRASVMANGAHGANVSHLRSTRISTSTITLNGQYAVMMPFGGLAGFRSNIVEGNGNDNGVLLRGGTLASDATMASNISWVLNEEAGSPTIGAGAALTVEPGSTLRFATGAGLIVHGTLNATSTTGRSTPVGRHPWGSAFDPATNRLYVATRDADTLSVVNTISATELFTVPVGSAPIDVALDSARNRIYVSQSGDGHLLALDKETFAPLADYRVGGAPAGMALDPATGRLFVALAADNAIAIVNGDTLTTTATVPVGCNPRDVAYNPANGRAYVANYCDGTVSVVATSPTVTVTKVITTGIGPWKIGVDATRNRVFVLNDVESTISVISGVTDTVIETLPVAGGASGIAFDQVNDYLYVANWRANTVTRLAGNDWAVMDTFPTGGYPIDVIVTGPVQDVYISNSRTDDLTIVSADEASPPAHPIMFTSHAQAPAPGDWKGVVFEAGSTGRLRHATVAYGGQPAAGYGNLFIKSDDVHVLNSALHHSGSDGVRVSNASPLLAGGSIEGSAGYGLRAQSLANPAVIANDIAANANYAAYIDRTAFPIFVGNQVAGNGTNGIRVDGGSLTVSGAWTTDGALPYVLLGTVTVNPGVTLSVGTGTLHAQGGTVIKPATASVNLIVNGGLAINGLACQPVVITSLHDDSHGGDTNNNGPSAGAPGQWGGIKITGQGNNVFAAVRYAKVLYGGYYSCSGGSCAGSEAAIHSSAPAGVLAVFDSEVSHSARHGLYIDGTASEIGRSRIQNNQSSGVHVRNSSPHIIDNAVSASQYGVYLDASPNYAMTGSITGNQFADHSVAAMRISLTNAGSQIVIEGNSASNCAINGILIGGTIGLPSVWTNNPGIPYVIFQGFWYNPGSTYYSHHLRVNTGQSLTIQPGTVVKFQPGSDAANNTTSIHVNGSLVAQGTPEQPIVFTSLQHDAFGGDTNNDQNTSSPARGDWGGLRTLDAGANATLHHVKVLYGGRWRSYGGDTGGSQSNVFVDGGSLHLTGSQVRLSAREGIRSQSAFPTITNNDISDNAQYGVYNASSAAISAVNNWWGSDLGPFHTVSNPAGAGNPVTDGVEYDPWLIQPPP